MSVTISANSVSRRHAQIENKNGSWELRDLESSNGTVVNNTSVIACTLACGDRVALGQVAFYAVFDLGEAGAAEPPAQTAIARTARVCNRMRTQRDNHAVDVATQPLRLVEPTGGGGGFVELASARVQLSATQLELVELLSTRMREDMHLPLSVRGFVRSSELVGALSWDTTTPNETHVKQLVRRVRRTLLRSGVGDLIEARHRLGYRLRVSADGD
jgi:hypothetical protein